jgi:WD40 repeat protein
MLALAYGANTIQILDTSTWREVSKKVFDKRSNCCINLQWSENSHQIVASPYVGLLQVLDAQTLNVAKEIVIPGDHTEYSTYTYTKLGNKLAIAEEKKPIMIFDLKSGQFEKEFSDVTSYSSGLVFSPDGDVLVSWCHDNSVYFWHTNTGKKLARVHEYTLRMIEPVYPSFHPIRPSLVTFCDKIRSMRVWDIDYKELLG